ncbi:hypothetical protein F5Y19DRAFT_121673 [Xylariaceae sp. FL1651]|nr:hypothetical protein F5Y19DRAFT_121673 [Xylariaceae sp. FL1651]
MSDQPPPPPPHGTNPRSTNPNLPPGKYDIFIIPPHSSGSGFLYLPSLKPNVNSFAAGFASALVLVVLCQSMAPAFRVWWNSFQGMGNMGMLLLVIAVGVGAWALGRTQNEGGPPPGSGGGPSHSWSYNPGGSGHTGGGSHSGAGSSHNSRPPDPEGPPPPPPPHGSPPPPQPGPPPNTSGPEKPKPSWQQRPQAENPKGSWEKAREETRRKEEERKQKEAEQRKKDEVARRLRELREKEARERAKREQEARERREKEAREREDREREAREKREKEIREREAKEREEKEAREREEREREARERQEKEAREKEQREREQREQEQKEKAQREKELRERRLQEARERELRERFEREKALREKLEREAKEREAARLKEAQAAKAAEEAKAKATETTRKSTYAFSSVGEKTNPWPNGKPPTQPPSPTKPSPAPSSVRRPPPPTAKSFHGTDEDAYSYRPYDQPRSHTRRRSGETIFTESSYAPSQSTSRTTPPPSMRGPYATKDPDKIVIKAVYGFLNQFSKTPASQLVSGVGSVTDGLILRITTEGLFIDDDVRGVPQREWDVKAWTLKLMEAFCPSHDSSGTNASPRVVNKTAGTPRFKFSGRGQSKTLMGDDADAYLTELLHSCKDECRLAPHGGSDTASSYGNSTQGGEWKHRGLHILRATIKDQEGKRYLFILGEEEGWKVAVGLQRLRKGTQARQLGYQPMPIKEARNTVEMLGW